MFFAHGLRKETALRAYHKKTLWKLIRSMIDGMLQDAEEHYQTLLQASPKPHVLDDYTISRVFEVLGRQKDDLWLFEEQLARWKMDKLSVAQRDEIGRAHV